MNTVKEQIEYFRVMEKERLRERQETFDKIMLLAKSLCPISYESFAYRLYYELDLKYTVSAKKGVTQKDIDTLIGIGKLHKSEDGKLTLPLHKKTVRH